VSWFRRHIGPPPPPKPTWIGNTWRALIAAAPVRLWAQIIAAGSFLGFMVATSAAIRFGPWSSSVEGKRIDALFWLGVAAAFLALFALGAITQQRFGLKVSKAGLESDVQHDDPPPAVTVNTTTTVTQDPATKV
jgi:hypothetical protein